MNHNNVTECADKCGLTLNAKNMNDILKYKNVSSIDIDVLKSILGPKKYEKYGLSFLGELKTLSVSVQKKKIETEKSDAEKYIETERNDAEKAVETERSENKVERNEDKVEQSDAEKTFEAFNNSTNLNGMAMIPSILTDTEKQKDTERSFSIDQNLMDKMIMMAPELKNPIKNIEDIEDTFGFQAYKNKILNADTTNNIIASKDTIIVEYQQLISEKDKIIVEKDRIISEKEGIIRCNQETIQKLIKSHENIIPFKTTVTASNDVESVIGSVSDDPKSFIFIEKHTDELVKVTGKTYDHRHIIKQIDNCSWTKEITGWTIPVDKVETLKTLFTENGISFIHKE